MRRGARAVVGIVAILALAGCGGPGGSGAAPPTRPTDTTPPPTGSTTSATNPAPTTSPSARTPSSAPRATESADPRWRFFTSDRTHYTSPWFAGERRVMIGYGCNGAPWYVHDPRCPGRQGFHHGIDIALPCGTPLYAGVAGVVLDPSEPGRPGSAYGSHAFRIRSGDHDILIGHSRPPAVQPGDRVRAGQPIARASDSAAPDGCHLHFEVRRAGGGLDAAVDPSPWLDLR